MISNGETSNPSIGSTLYVSSTVSRCSSRWFLISAFAVHVVDAMADRRSQKAVKSFHASIRRWLVRCRFVFSCSKVFQKRLYFIRHEVSPSVADHPRWYRVIRDVLCANIARWLQSQSARSDTLTANVRMGHRW